MFIVYSYMFVYAIKWWWWWWWWWWKSDICWRQFY